ncbi:hypothetical protein P8452_02123 [Trifolium repens]|nr:hypothetical protein P8452_02123 [Trifolium repens]
MCNVHIGDQIPFIFFLYSPHHGFPQFFFSLVSSNVITSLETSTITTATRICSAITKNSTSTSGSLHSPLFLIIG